MNEELVIIITNPNHHWLNSKPIIQYVINKNKKVKLLSFCGLRRLKSPSIINFNTLEFHEWGKKVYKEKSKTLINNVVAKQSKRKKLLQYTVFYTSLLPFLKRYINQHSKVLLFNDVAYPMNLFCKYLNEKTIDYYLLQEGIRFPLPNVLESNSYGASGAKAIFTWGNKPKNHFLNVIKGTNTKIYITGAPRYSTIINNYFENKEDKNLLGIFTNPIDLLGFCSNIDKQQLFSNFIHNIKDWLIDNRINILLKIHPSEKWSTYESVLNDLKIPYTRGPNDIFKAINMAKAGVIMASTVGLELLLFKKNVAQLPLPTGDYVFDYIKENVALPIKTKEFELDKWNEWWKTKVEDKKRIDFLNNHLWVEGKSEEIIYNAIFS